MVRITINLKYLKIFTLLINISFVLFACNTNNDTNKSPTVLSDEVKTVGKLMDTVAKNKSETIALKENKSIEFITIDNLDITIKDLGFFDSKQADIECQKLGDGWRLPTEAELNVIYEQNDKLGTFKTNYYLGLGYEPDAYNENEDVKMFLRISIINGEVVILQSDQELFSQYGVRAVRDHKL